MFRHSVSVNCCKNFVWARRIRENLAPGFTGNIPPCWWPPPPPGGDIPGEPGIQVPTKSSGSHEIFAATHAVLARIWLQGISVFPVKWRNSSYHTQHAGNIFLSQEEISCLRKKFLVSGRNFLALEEISCHRKKLFVKGRNFMPQL